MGNEQSQQAQEQVPAQEEHHTSGSEQQSAPTPNTAKVQQEQNGFKPPVSQAELDRIIQERLARSEEKVRREFQGYIAPSAYEETTKERDQLREQLQREQRENAALAAGLEASDADRLKGESKDEWFADAKGFAERFARSASPRRSPQEQRGLGGGYPQEPEPKRSPREMVKNIPRL